MSYTRNNLEGLDDLLYLDQTGVRTDKNRNVMIKACLENNIDYILWLDADMVYPQDIVCKYFEHEFDIIGCVYFKRKHPYDPVLYVDGTNPIKPYKMVDPTTLEPDTITEVDGIGFGGVMVKTDVYRAMGEDKWMNYGLNYHLPYETTDQLTHDLVWCKTAKKYGYKIYVHSGVVAKHVQDYEIGIEDFIRAKEEKKVDKINVIMPSIDVKKAEATAKQLSIRAGIEHKMIVVEDVERNGFTATFNSTAKANLADYYVYVAEDAFAGRNWLLEAYKTAKSTNAGLVAFNDGKWNGQLASFGMIQHEWGVKNYGGDLLFSGYKTHYADTELTEIAKEQKRYAYNPEAVLVEVDPDKESKSVNEDDKKLFNERKQAHWPESW